jgi:competence protein ComEC
VLATHGVAPAGALIAVRGLAHREGGFVSFIEATVTAVAPPGLLAQWRSRMGRVIDDLYGSHAPLARALLVADEHDIAPEVRRTFADAGIIHMLSVSGLHVAVLAEAVALTVLLCGAGSRRAELVAVVVTGTFVLFVGAPAPAVRAGAMYAAMVVSRRLQRPTSPWAILTVGAILPLVDPRVVRDVGYQLSVAGMAGLIASGELSRRIAPPGRLLASGRLFREMLATVVTSAVTAPIVAWQFGRLSVAAPLTNLAAAPLFALAQPALFLSLLCSPVHPVARFIADGAGILLSGIGWVARIGAAIPGAALDVMPSVLTACLITTASVALIVACVSRHWPRALLAGGAAVGAALWWPLLSPGAGLIELHVIDVGQGDALAVRTPAGRWIVVDAGEEWRTGDAGARVVAPYLRRRGGDIAALVLTHPHSDHIGGAASLLRLMHVTAVYDGGLAFPSAVYDSLLTTARARSVPWRVVRTGDRLMVDGIAIHVLGPDSSSVARARDPNEVSVVLLVEHHGIRLLLTGDAERVEELRILGEFGDALHADVLKVGHHGSNTSSSDAFLDAVHPLVAVVSVGTGNHFGHPSAHVMSDFTTRGVELLRTDHDGTVVISAVGRTLRIHTNDASWSLPLGHPSPP